MWCFGAVITWTAAISAWTVCYTVYQDEKIQMPVWTKSKKFFVETEVQQLNPRGILLHNQDFAFTQGTDALSKEFWTVLVERVTIQILALSKSLGFSLLSKEQSTGVKWILMVATLAYVAITCKTSIQIRKWELSMDRLIPSTLVHLSTFERIFKTIRLAECGRWNSKYALNALRGIWCN